ncbi:MAG: hypothetical protein J0H08_17930 [Rhizobiales bacterium]|nr:hypothetical protein [Hyphomicrobiales bacterium]
MRLVRYRHVGHALTVIALALPAPLRWLLPVAREVAGFVTGTPQPARGNALSETEAA